MVKTFSIIVSLLCLLLSSGLSFGDTHQETLERANTAYYKNQFNVAEQLYKNLLAQGISNGHLFYNLANVYYRKGEFGEALQYYYKALRFLPRDADVRANLEFVDKKSIDKFEDPVQVSFLKIFFFWYTYFTLKELVIGFVFSAGIFWFVAWLFLILRRGSLKWTAIILFVFSLILGFSTSFKFDMEKRKSWGVILRTEVDVRPTYLEQGKALFKLHEGVKVQVVGRQQFSDQDSWTQIRLPEGQKGWVKNEDIGII